MSKRTLGRLAALIGAAAATMALAAPASAWFGDVRAEVRTDATVMGFGPGIPAGFGISWRETVDAGASGQASSSYGWPLPAGPWATYPSGPCDPCAWRDARTFAEIDRAAGVLRAGAFGEIGTGGTSVSNAGFNQTWARAELEDTITLSEPATVLLRGRLTGRHAKTQSHHEWYGDPRGSLDLRIGFTAYDEDAPEWPFTPLGGVDLGYESPFYGCAYPATCFSPGQAIPGPAAIDETFEVEVELPAGETFFAASLYAGVDIQVWGARSDAHRDFHWGAELVDGSTTATFEIVVPEGVVATSGSGQLPIVGGSSGGGDPDPDPEEPAAAEQLEELAGAVAALAVQPAGLKTAFGAKLAAAAKALADGDTAAACAALQDFANHVKAQSGKKVAAATAAELIAAAQAIRTALGCA